jgi:hypothetical protein
MTSLIILYAEFSDKEITLCCPAIKIVIPYLFFLMVSSVHCRSHRISVYSTGDLLKFFCLCFFCFLRLLMETNLLIITKNLWTVHLGICST